MWSQELSKVRIPTRSFSWAFRIWRPSKWVVKRHLDGEEETIPTVILDSPISVRPPHPDPDEVRLIGLETKSQYACLIIF